MKSFVFTLVFCFAALQLGSTDKDNSAVKCLIENGFKSTDTELLKAIGKSNSAELLENVPKDKLACVIACFYNRESETGDSLDYMLYKQTFADQRPYFNDKRKAMLETLATCKTQVGSNDCKLLHCIKALESPFVDLFSVRSMTTDERACLVINGVQVGLVYFLNIINMPLHEKLKYVTEDDLACSEACAYASELHSNKTLNEHFIEVIQKDKQLSEDYKKEMLVTLSNCNKQADGDNCELVKCIQVYKPPFYQTLILNWQKKQTTNVKKELTV